MQSTIIICGKQGSGKSTFAKNYAELYSYDYYYFDGQSNTPTYCLKTAISEKKKLVIIDDLKFSESLCFLFKDEIKIRTYYERKPTIHKVPNIIIVTQTKRQKVKRILQKQNITNYTLLTIN